MNSLRVSINVRIRYSTIYHYLFILRVTSLYIIAKRTHDINTNNYDCYYHKWPLTYL